MHSIKFDAAFITDFDVLRGDIRSSSVSSALRFASCLRAAPCLSHMVPMCSITQAATITGTLISIFRTERWMWSCSICRTSRTL